MGIRISRVNIWGIVCGVVYGLCLRLIFGKEHFHSSALSVMTISFVFFVPLVLGILTVQCASKPSWIYSIFAPWISILFFVSATSLLGLEGLICIVMATPIFLLMSSIGGILAKVILNLKESRRTFIFTGFLFLPFISSAIESQFVVPPSQRVVPTQIVINAPVNIVWKNIIRVPKIQPQEHHFSLFHAIGFPKPIEATLSHEGIGGVRHASFEGGLLFICGRRRERDHVWPRWFFPKHDSAQGIQFYGQTLPMDPLSIAHTLNYFLVR